ncbi:hypothetical protein An09g03580 [Aspergillus niger]|uniref:Uncharacterized protein n=2 Tax=Aspergillus niger TaxID=5061 RepID=A2QTX3_ASPNC|nr:hypothetical protein An09g03580 [Aspergillus niger]CAK96801.1 hypothetical protein An09g03580 [Aspergillus niger]
MPIFSHALVLIFATSFSITVAYIILIILTVDLYYATPATATAANTLIYENVGGMVGEVNHDSETELQYLPVNNIHRPVTLKPTMIEIIKTTIQEPTYILSRIVLSINPLHTIVRPSISTIPTPRESSPATLSKYQTRNPSQSSAPSTSPNTKPTSSSSPTSTSLQPDHSNRHPPLVPARPDLLQQQQQQYTLPQPTQSTQKTSNLTSPPKPPPNCHHRYLYLLYTQPPEYIFPECFVSSIYSHPEWRHEQDSI